MKVENLLNKIAKSKDINGEEYLQISGALWAIVSINNKPEITPEEIFRIYGEGLRELE